MAAVHRKRRAMPQRIAKRKQTIFQSDVDAFLKRAFPIPWTHEGQIGQFGVREIIERPLPVKGFLSDFFMVKRIMNLIGPFIY
jgi:hypothetical protein